MAIEFKDIEFKNDKITKFDGQYSWLSNFHRCHVFGYQSVEHAYQASKCVFVNGSIEVHCQDTPGQAKRTGRKMIMHPTFEERKLAIMEALLREKFSPMNDALMWELIETGDAQLIEGNDWGDDFWGVDNKTGLGANHLGRLLMLIRSELQAQFANKMDTEDKMPFVDGRSFRCDCGCNVFRNPVGQPMIYVCNSCGERYQGEK